MKDNVAQIEEVVEQKITDLPNTKKAVNEGIGHVFQGNEKLYNRNEVKDIKQLGDRYEVLDRYNQKYKFIRLEQGKNFKTMIQENPRILLNIWDSLSQKTFGSSEEEKEVMIITIVEYCKSGMNIDSNSYFGGYIETYSKILTHIKSNQKYKDEKNIEDKILQFWSDFLFLASRENTSGIVGYSYRTFTDFGHQAYSYIKQRMDGGPKQEEFIQTKKTVVSKATLADILKSVGEIGMIEDKGYTLEDALDASNEHFSGRSLKLALYLGYLQNKIKKNDGDTDNQLSTKNMIIAILYSHKKEFGQLQGRELVEMIKMTIAYITRYKNIKLLKEKYHIVGNQFFGEQKKSFIQQFYKVPNDQLERVLKETNIYIADGAITTVTKQNDVFHILGDFEKKDGNETSNEGIVGNAKNKDGINIVLLNHSPKALQLRKNLPNNNVFKHEKFGHISNYTYLNINRADVFSEYMIQSGSDELIAWIVGGGTKENLYRFFLNFANYDYINRIVVTYSGISIRLVKDGPFVKKIKENYLRSMRFYIQIAEELKMYFKYVGEGDDIKRYFENLLRTNPITERSMIKRDLILRKTFDLVQEDVDRIQEKFRMMSSVSIGILKEKYPEIFNDRLGKERIDSHENEIDERIMNIIYTDDEIKKFLFQ